MSEFFDAIYAAISFACDTPQLPEWMTNVRADPDTFRGTAQHERLLTELQSSFKRAQLDAAGVTQPRGRGIELKNFFTAPEREFIVLHDQSGRKFDILTE